MTLIEAKGHSGTVIFDGALITISRSGLARLTLGKGDKQIPLAHITAVHWKPAGRLINGFIQFTMPGAVEVQSRAGRQTYDAAKDENAVVFTRGQEKDFVALLNAVQSAIAGRVTGDMQ